MNSNELHKQIGQLLGNLKDLNTRLLENEGAYSQAEIDEFKSNTLELYDTIHRLQLENWIPPISVAEKEIESVEVVSIPEVIDIIEVTEIQTPIADSEEIKIPISEIKMPSNFDAPKFVPVIEKPTPVAETPKQAKPTEKSILDKINESQSKNSLHEILVSTSDSDGWSDRFTNSKINKIKDAIDISKRFEIQSNLFGGDTHSYVTFINAIESADGLESALEHFKEVAIRYHWNAEAELVMELKSFIYRKY